MASGVNIPVGAADNASGPLEKIRDRFERLGTSGGVKSFTTGLGMGAGIGVFNMAVGAVKGVADAMGDMVGAALDDEANVAKLQRTLSNSIPDWKAHAGAIDQAITAGQKLGFTDDQMRDSLGALAARTKDLTQATNLNQLAMDLSRAKGIDLATASNLIGKVYSGNVGILSRYGIAVEKGASSTEALAAIQKMAGGQAETYGKSTKGSMEALGVAFAEVGESVGKALLPLLNALVPIIRDKLMPVVVALAGGLAMLIEAATPLISFVLDAMITGFKIVADVVLTAGQALLTVAAAIPGPWQQGANDMNAALQKIKDGLSDTSAYSSAIANDVGPQVGGALAEGADDVEAGADEMFDGMPDAATKAGKATVTATEESLGQIVGAIRGSRDEFASAWKQALDAGAREQAIAAELQQVAADLADKDLAKRLKSKDAAIRAAAQQELAELKRHQSELLAEQSTYGDSATQIARTKALLSSQAMVDGLRSNDPQVAAYWRAIQKGAQDRLGELSKDVYGYGRDAGENYGTGLGSKPAVKAVDAGGGRLITEAKGNLDAKAVPAAEWGTGVGKEWAAGLGSQAVMNSIIKAALKMQSQAGKFLESGSPPKEGPMHRIDIWGREVGRVWADSLSAGARGFRLPLPAGMASTAAGMASGAGGASGGLLGGPTVSITIERWYGDRDGVIALSREIGQQVRLATIKGAS